jgi:hypothetical protein
MRRTFSSVRKGTAEMTDPDKLRELASWYREFAVRSGSVAIWAPRLEMAADLDREADKLDPVKQGRSYAVAASSVSAEG